MRAAGLREACAMRTADVRCGGSEAGSRRLRHALRREACDAAIAQVAHLLGGARLGEGRSLLGDVVLQTLGGGGVSTVDVHEGVVA